MRKSAIQRVLHMKESQQGMQQKEINKMPKKGKNKQNKVVSSKQRYFSYSSTEQSCWAYYSLCLSLSVAN